MRPLATLLLLAALLFPVLLLPALAAADECSNYFQDVDYYLEQYRYRYEQENYWGAAEALRNASNSFERASWVCPEEPAAEAKRMYEKTRQDAEDIEGMARSVDYFDQGGEHYHRGLQYYDDNEYALCEEEFQEAARLFQLSVDADPEDSEAPRNNKQVALNKADDCREMQEYFEARQKEAAQSAYDAGRECFVKGNQYYDESKYAQCNEQYLEAARLLQQAMDADPDLAESISPDKEKALSNAKICQKLEEVGIDAEAAVNDALSESASATGPSQDGRPPLANPNQARLDELEYLINKLTDQALALTEEERFPEAADGFAQAIPLLAEMRKLYAEYDPASAADASEIQHNCHTAAADCWTLAMEQAQPDLDRADALLAQGNGAEAAAIYERLAGYVSKGVYFWRGGEKEAGQETLEILNAKLEKAKALAGNPAQDSQGSQGDLEAQKGRDLYRSGVNIAKAGRYAEALQAYRLAVMHLKQASPTDQISQEEIDTLLQRALMGVELMEGKTEQVAEDNAPNECSSLYQEATDLEASCQETGHCSQAIRAYSSAARICSQETAAQALERILDLCSKAEKGSLSSADLVGIWSIKEYTIPGDAAYSGWLVVHDHSPDEEIYQGTLILGFQNEKGQAHVLQDAKIIPPLSDGFQIRGQNPVRFPSSDKSIYLSDVFTCSFFNPFLNVLGCRISYSDCCATEVRMERQQ